MKHVHITVVILVLLGPAILHADDKNQADPNDKELLGTWVAEEADALGKNVPRSEAGKMRLVFSKDKVVWQFDRPDGTVTSHTGKYRADPKKSPKEIDLGPPGAKTETVTALCIYKIEADKLIVLMGRDSMRPTNFEEKALARLAFRKKSP